jgi:hypothetical protein
MFTLLIAASITITTSAPPLSPAEAVHVLQASKSSADMTDFRAAPVATLPPSPIVVERRVEKVPASTPFRPLNCCGTYSTPLPVPTINVNVSSARVGRRER